MLPLWEKCETFLKGEEAVKAAGIAYLPKTSGMEKAAAGVQYYEAYKSRARVFDLASQSLNALLGLVLEKLPEGNPDRIFTSNGETDIDFSAHILRELFAKGRYILVEDYVEGTDILTSGYAAESFINWKMDAAGALTLAVFKEDIVASGGFSHTADTQYRVYTLQSGSYTVELFDEKGGNLPVNGEATGEVLLTVPRDALPITVIGSIDLSPDCDPIPLLPIVNCALSAYQLSADYKHSLFLVAQPTPWVKGINEKAWENIHAQGGGSAALWWLGDEGETGYLEVAGGGIDSLRQALTDELKQAESHSVRLTQQDSGNVESGSSLTVRAHAQHATIHTIIRALEHGIAAAWETMVSRSSTAAADAFRIQADFSPLQASAQMLTAMSNAVGQTTIPQTVLFEALRKFKLTERTDEELLADLANGSFALPVPTNETPPK